MVAQPRCSCSIHERRSRPDGTHQVSGCALEMHMQRGIASARRGFFWSSPISTSSSTARAFILVRPCIDRAGAVRRADLLLALAVPRSRACQAAGVRAIGRREAACARAATRFSAAAAARSMKAAATRLEKYAGAVLQLFTVWCVMVCGGTAVATTGEWRSRGSLAGAAQESFYIQLHGANWASAGSILKVGVQGCRFVRVDDERA